MKKLPKLLIVIMLISCSAMLFSACNKKSGQFEFAIENNEVIIKNYQDNSKITEIIVPDEIGGLPVTKIDNAGLTNSNYLTKITIGKNVKEIAPRAIQNNRQVTEFVVAEGNTSFKTVDGVLYTIDGTELVSYPINAEIKTRVVIKEGVSVTEYYRKEFVVPNGVVTIRPSAFYHASHNEKIVLPDTVKFIGEAAFLKCDFLSDINMPKDLEVIGKDAFHGNLLMKEITIHSKITQIDTFAFYDCKNLLKINLCKAKADVKLGNKWFPTDLGKTIKTLEINWNYSCGME